MLNRTAVIFVFIIIALNQLNATVRLPSIVGDSMILQRNVKLKIWGWADKNETVKIDFKGKRYSAKADSNGKWIVWINPSPAGGPHTMEINGKDNSITLKNILMGDVWLCAGQSNMVHSLELHADRYKNEIQKANYISIRHFVVPNKSILKGPSDQLSDGSWQTATSKNILRFSVVAYFFALKLHEKYNVPIGIINASVGGTPIESWTSEDGLKEFPDILKVIQQNKDSIYVAQTNRKAALRSRAINKMRQSDKGMLESPKWFELSYSPKNWSNINIPGYWEDQGIENLDGVVWYRREFNIPEPMIGKPARISMGRIVDADNIYINGIMVGNKTYQYPQRRYEFASNVLKPGKNLIVVRVVNYSGKGGFVPDKPYYLAAGKDTIDLKGYWQYKVGEVFRPVPGSTPGISIQNQPTALYNGMIAPYTNFALRGMVWYQGESNTGNPEQYDYLLPALIKDWRSQWGLGDLSFLSVQLPNFMDVNYLPSESDWARLREAQLKSLRINNTALVVTIDLGEWNDIHPDVKKPIGDRLALAAQRLAYNEKGVVYSGPIYSSATAVDNKVLLSFDHTGSGLISNDGEDLKWFAIAGDDKKFVWANTVIKNNQVEVWSEEVLAPVYIRYAWADNPARANLYNKEGLPASPFQATVADINKLWHGKKAAVVLTYDDALEVHLDNVIPMMDSLNIKGSFYLSAGFPGSKNRINDWSKAAKRGHELGNHLWYHPCDASKPGRSWVSAQNDLSKHTTNQLVRESEMTNTFLQSLDGRTERTFAYTCGDTDTGEGSFINAIKNQFVSMRGVRGRINKMESIDLTNIDCFVADENNQDQLISWAEKAKQENGLLVILFHGVGGGHNINVDLNTHNDFLKYLKSHPHDFWVTTMLDASKHIIEQSKK